MKSSIVPSLRIIKHLLGPNKSLVLTATLSIHCSRCVCQSIRSPTLPISLWRAHLVTCLVPIVFEFNILDSHYLWAITSHSNSRPSTNSDPHHSGAGPLQVTISRSSKNTLPVFFPSISHYQTLNASLKPFIKYSVDLVNPPTPSKQ